MSMSSSRPADPALRAALASGLQADSPGAARTLCCHLPEGRASRPQPSQYRPSRGKQGLLPPHTHPPRLPGPSPGLAPPCQAGLCPLLGTRCCDFGSHISALPLDGASQGQNPHWPPCAHSSVSHQSFVGRRSPVSPQGQSWVRDPRGPSSPCGSCVPAQQGLGTGAVPPNGFRVQVGGRRPPCPPSSPFDPGLACLSPLA